MSPQAEVDRLWRKLKTNAGDGYGHPLEWIHDLFRVVEQLF
jgi:predicted 3-demethylubiquinone-9 3-methyltransferase (glyoxalase superfamily)